MRVEDFCAGVRDVHAYLHKETLDARGRPSRLHWLDRAKQGPVPVDIAASGPKVIAFAARTVERVTFAVGADPARLAWALELARSELADEGRAGTAVSFGAYINVGCDPDPSTGRNLIRGSSAAFAHFSAMPGSTGAGLDARDRDVVAEVGRRYDSNHHLFNSADHSSVMPDEFIDRFAVVGDPQTCARRLLELTALGLQRLVLTGPTIDAEPEPARLSRRLVVEELVPALREGAAARL
jgi:5,10-methylenetetrahydromethanopterin reductase